MKKTSFEILIIEDEVEIANILKTYLKLYPKFQKIIIAENSLQATQKLSNQSFDLVITDFQLGKRDALEFIDRIKKQPKYYNLKFMVVSGCLTTEITTSLMQKGIRHILVKPFSARQILLNAISCLGIEKKPKDLVDNIIDQVKNRFSDDRERLQNSIPDDKLAEMIKNSKGKK